MQHEERICVARPYFALDDVEVVGGALAGVVRNTPVDLGLCVRHAGTLAALACSLAWPRPGPHGWPVATLVVQGPLLVAPRRVDTMQLRARCVAVTPTRNRAEAEAQVDAGRQRWALRTTHRVVPKDELRGHGPSRPSPQGVVGFFDGEPATAPDAIVALAMGVLDPAGAMRLTLELDRVAWGPVTVHLGAAPRTADVLAADGAHIGRVSIA